MLVYDIEIKNAIPAKGEDRLPGIEYASGWEDHKGMGISVIACYDAKTKQMRLFDESTLTVFRKLCDERAPICGYNILHFDNKLLAAHGVNLDAAKCYDLHAEVMDALGGRRVKLDDLAAANGVGSKTMKGALAPIEWQMGRYMRVADYCAQDVYLTTDLLRLVHRQGWLWHPYEEGRKIEIKRRP